MSSYLIGRPNCVPALLLHAAVATLAVAALVPSPTVAQTQEEKEKLRKRGPPPKQQPKQAHPQPKLINPGAQRLPPPRAVAPRVPPKGPVVTTPQRVAPPPPRTVPPKFVAPKPGLPPPKAPVVTSPKRFDPPRTVAPKVVVPPPGKPAIGAPKRFDGPRTVTPKVITPTAPNLVSPRAIPKATTPIAPPVKSVTPGIRAPIRPIAGPRNFDQIRKGRVQTTTKAGLTQIKEPGNRTIVRQGGRTIITRNESATFRALAPGAKSSRRGDGITETVFTRRDGTRVISETDRSGRLLRRYRRGPDGRVFNLVDNRRFYRNVAIGLGAAALATVAIVALSPPAHAIPRREYIVDYAEASDEEIYAALTAPPVEHLERRYSLDEIRYSPSLRDRVRRVDLDNINFEFGSFEITPDQFPKLERMARALLRAIEANPAEVFLIEGHTDAVGEEEDNLSLSDRRAEAVAQILVEQFEVPMENLVTQGYGEQQLKVPTQEPERANRRVTMRRITPLLSQQEEQQR